MMPSANSAKREVAGQRPQRLGRLRGGLDVGDACDVQRRRRAEDDAERDDVGERHAEVGVDLDAVAGARRAPSGACASAPAAGSALRSSTSCDACQKNRYGLIVVPKTATITVRYCRGQREMRPHRVRGHLAPGDVYREHQDDVREQRQRQPLQVADIALVGQENLQQQASDADHDRVHMRRSADDQLQRLAHRGDVGGDVDGVGDDQQRDDAVAGPAARRCRPMFAARPWPVTRPMRALTSWMPTISG